MDHDCKNNGKIDWFQWDTIKVKKFKVPIYQYQILDKTASLHLVRIILRFQLMRIKVAGYII